MTNLQKTIHLSNSTFHEKPSHGLLEKNAEECLLRRGLRHSQKAHSAELHFISSHRVWEERGRLLQSYTTIKVACGDDLIGLSFKWSFCEMPNNHQLVCIPFFFFNRNLFWNVLNHLKFKEGQILISHLSVRAGWLTQGNYYVEMMTRQNKCDGFPSLTLSILSTRAHTDFSFKYLEISLTP